MTIKDLSDSNVLLDAFNKAKIDSDWKMSVQEFEANLLINITQLSKELREGTYQQLPFYEFILHERGKTRYIKSLHIRDRVIQRALCDNILAPLLYKKLIYDNGASVKYKGISFTRNRLQAHLEKYIRENGIEGYILLIDFSKFFDNIPHDLFLQQLRPLIKDDETFNLIKQLVDSFHLNVSYLSDEEFKELENKPFNMLTFQHSDKEDKILYRSMGIGSQISQLAGIFYLTPIDNYCKIVKQYKYYGRYMDDIYIISNSKEELKQLLTEIYKIAEKLKIFINKDKTQIIKLTHGFTFLQIKYKITSSGRIIKTLSPRSISRERRRLYKYANMLTDHRLTYPIIENAYRSWRGNAIRYSCYKSLTSLDNLYLTLFNKNISPKFKQQLKSKYKK